MTRKSKQKFEYLDKEKRLSDEIKNTFIEANKTNFFGIK